MAGFGDGFDAPSTLDLYLTTNDQLGYGQNGAIRSISGAVIDLPKFGGTYTTNELRQMMEGGFDLARSYEALGYQYGPGWSQSGHDYDPQLSDDYYRAAFGIDSNLARATVFGGEIVDDRWSNPYPQQPNFNVFAYYHDKNLKGLGNAAGGMAVGLTRGNAFKDVDFEAAFGKTGSSTIGRNGGYTASELKAIDAKVKERFDRLNRNDRTGKDFTKAGKENVRDINRQLNYGVEVCEGCGAEVISPKQSKRGIIPPKNEAHVDHIKRKSEGGSGTPDNGQVLCRNCNVNEKH